MHVGQEQSPKSDCEYGVLQGSVLGLLLCTLYISPVASIVSSFGIDHAQYADNTQLYVALKDESLPALTQCIQALHHWLDCNGLWLNPEKTGAVILGTTSRSGLGSRSTHSILERSTSKHLTVSRVLVFSLTVQSLSTSM